MYARCDLCFYIFSDGGGDSGGDGVTVRFYACGDLFLCGGGRLCFDIIVGELAYKLIEYGGVVILCQLRNVQTRALE